MSAAAPRKLLLQLLAESKTEDGFLHGVAESLPKLFGAEWCDILLKDATEGLVLRASTAVPEMTRRLRIGRGIGICGLVQATGNPVFLAENASSHPQYARYPGLEERDGAGIAVIPLQSMGATLGVVLLTHSGVWEVPKNVRVRMLQTAEEIASMLSGWRAAYAAGTQTDRLGALSEVSRTIATSPYLEEILQLLVHLTAAQFNYRVCTVRLLDERHNELVLRATQAPAKAYQRKRAIKLGESIAGRVIAENRPVMVADVQTEADYIGHDLAVEQGLRSMICVPLKLGDRPIGVLSCYTSEVRQFAADEIVALETLAQQAAVSIEHAKLQVRDTLMQEMHHRVKNNLQQVASLLRLQLRHGKYKSLEEALNDSLARILAIASVHDLLSREDLDHVGIRSIAEMLAGHQQSSLILPDRRISFQVRGDDVRLNMNQATQVALILNELISNAVEHGFATARVGEIHVTIEEHEAEVDLWVSNNGDQLPPGFELGKSSSLGLQITDSLSRALGGQFKIENRLGWTVAEVKFQRASGE